MNKIDLMASYLFKGTSNSDLYLQQTESGSVELRSSFNELIATVDSDYELRRVLTDLNDGKYA